MQRFAAGGIILLGIFLILATTTYAQDDEPLPNEYVGDGECLACHRNMRNIRTSAHGLALQEPEGTILADFTQGEDIRTMNFGDEERPFTQDDVVFVMGAGRYVQNYVVITDEGRVVAPATWNVEQSEWLPYNGDEPILWETQCAACHTTGFDVETGEWVDDGVSCEACHGPGLNHVELGDVLPRSATGDDVQEVRNAIHLSPDPATCGQCHSQGLTAEAHPFPTDYLPGQDLLDGYDLVAPDDENHWWASGHGSSTNMRFNEWMVSGHANALQSVLDSENADDSCLACHSTDYRWRQELITLYEDGDYDGSEPTPITLETAQFGITCGTCHNPHLTVEVDEEAPESAEPAAFVGNFFLNEDVTCTQCHSDPDLSDGLHYPVQQMYEGQPVIDEVEAIASAHFTEEEGPNCTTCHMPRVPVNSFTLASHTMNIVSPGADVPFDDSCSVCHGEDVDAAGMAVLISDIQASTDARVAALQENLDGAPEWVEVAVAFVAEDSSRGIHNPNYANALLQAAETELGFNEVTEPELAPAPLPEITTPDTANEDDDDIPGLTTESLVIMIGSVLLILVAAWLFFVRGQSE